MNCKPGDLARAFRPGPFRDKLFFVLHAAPVWRDFLLPDGSLHVAVGPGYWVVESASGDLLPVGVSFGGKRLARYGCGPDAGLKPLRDDAGEDEMIRIAGKPERDLLKECDNLIRQFNDLAEQAKGLR